MYRLILYICTILFFVPAPVPARASALDMLFQRFKNKWIIVNNPVIREDGTGVFHAVYDAGSSIRYLKADPNADSLSREVYIPRQGITEGIGLGACQDGSAVVLYRPYHGSQEFLLIETTGAVADSGVLQGQGLRPKAFPAPDGNSILWGKNIPTAVSSQFNLPTLLEHGSAKLYSFTRSIGVLTVGTADAHMVNDSNIYVFTHRRSEPLEAYKKKEIDWPNLAIYKYNTWLGRITGSTLVPLDKNRDILSDDAIPFDGVQVVDDTSGNMIVFASYIDPEYGLHLRVFTLTPDLKVLPAPKYDIEREQPSIEIAKGVKQKRLFWFTHNHFWGTTTGFHQIALVGDKMLHQRIYDIPTSQKEIEEQGW